MRAGSLSRHLADLHEIYQGHVVAEELLDRHEGVMYKVKERHGKLNCPFPLCTGELAGGWMMRRHVCNLHPLDYVTVPRERRYPWCLCSGMQVDPGYPVVPMEISFMDTEDEYKKIWYLKITKVHIFKSIKVSDFFLGLASYSFSENLRGNVG
jgi:hypothetical protein